MKRFWMVGVLALALVGAYFWGRAHAAGVPSMQPLFYAGTLTDVAGAPASGSHGFIIKLYADSTTTSAACTFASTAMVTSGRFRLQLDDTCTAAVHANPDLYLELSVDTQPFPRTKLGAVPYALEAANASAVPLAGVTGITATTPWPGAVSPERVVDGTSTGFVRTRDTGGTLVLAANINGSVMQSTGTWISGVNKTGNGNYDVTFPNGVFAMAPMCTATAEFGATLAAVASGATTAGIHVAISDTAGTAVDEPFILFCVGR